MDVFSVIAVILAIVGIIGGVVPMIPGPAVSWGALLCLYFSDSSKTPLSTTSLFVWLAIAIVVTVVDYIVPPLMTKLAGGHKAAERGAMIGMLIGIFLTPVGMILGSLLGAFLGEFLSEDRDFGHSVKASLGAFAGFLLTTGLKVGMSCIILWKIITLL